MKNKIATLLSMLLILSADTAYSREFLDTILHINLGMAYGFTYGEVIDHEEDYRVDSDRPDHHLNSFGITFDIAPFRPYLMGHESHAFKIGVRGSYKIHFVEQQLSDNRSIDEQESLFSYRTWMVGPVIHYSPSVSTSEITGDYTSRGGFTMYALYGRLVSAELHTYPGARASGEPVLPADSGFPSSTKLEGYQLDIGVGGVVSVCAVNLGINLFYSYVNYTMSDRVYADVSRSGSMSQYVAEIYVGIPVEWIRIPRFL